MEALMRMLFIFAAPVIAIMYGLYALRWLARQIGSWWAIHSGHVIGYSITVLVLAVVGLMVVVGISTWWEAEKAKAQHRNALKQLDRKYQQTAQAIDQADTGNGQPGGKPTVRGWTVP